MPLVRDRVSDGELCVSALGAPRPGRRVATPDSTADRLAFEYESVRRFTESLCGPLAVEDYVIQSMPDVSPTKWHLAHTSWFFERFILTEHAANSGGGGGYEPFHPRFNYLFNSYYNTVGPQHCRVQRGLLSRPTVEEVFAYRAAVDDRMVELITGADDRLLDRLRPLVTLGLHHEQQHQELMLTDIKHVFSTNPLMPAYRDTKQGRLSDPASCAEARWIAFEEGVHEIGHTGEDFSFDNETPRHRVFLEPFALASRLTTNGEYLRFIEAGGYEKPELWLSMGWATVEQEGWTHPFYWYRRDGRWMHYTLAGPAPVDPAEPVCHLSYYEADAFARWAGARLPTEAEWEVAAADAPIEGNFADDRTFHPYPSNPEPRTPHPAQLFGDVWEWTSSQYTAYPGYQPPPGALGEYNGKFMCNQFVLRGGSCATARAHVRPTYRNFFPPDARWQFTGLRLARNL